MVVMTINRVIVKTRSGLTKCLKVQCCHKRWRSTKSRIPAPTWSTKDLKLTSSENEKDEIISDEELETLSRRCLIDTFRMNEDERNKLKIELGNMMRCISMVTSFEFGKDLSDEELEERMYDLPRGFSSRRSCPLRNDDAEETNSWRDEGKMEEANFLLGCLKKQNKLMQDKNGTTGFNWFFSAPNYK